MLGRFALLLALGACGRLGFDSIGKGIVSTDDGGGSNSEDASADDGATRVSSFAAIDLPTAVPPYTFTAAATNVGDLVVFQIACNGAPGPSAISSPTWAVTGVGVRAASPVREVAVDTFAAVAPDTATTTFMVTFNSSCQLTIYAAEFANVAGVSLASIDTVVNAFGTCTGSVTTVHASDTIWEACSGGTVSNPTPGYTLDSATDQYRVTNDPAGSIETPTLGGASTALMTLMAIAPQ
jgi:hypothetical protein